MFSAAILLAASALGAAAQETQTQTHYADSRLIAFVGNWEPCPTLEQIDRYTDVIVSFASTYTWTKKRNICSEDCTLSPNPVPVCDNAPQYDLVAEWKKRGKRVILSFGGAGMGGDLRGDKNNCWDYCFGREEYVVDQLLDAVEQQGFDGVDIDYEYHLDTFKHDKMNVAAQYFLETIVSDLRDRLPPNSILTMVPMDSDIWADHKAFYQILQRNADKLDFLMVQYYNGIVRPNLHGLDGVDRRFGISSLDHYTRLVDTLFDGDASRVVFGFCIDACPASRSNIDGHVAAKVMEDLQSVYSCNGGAFFWVASGDGPDASWSSEVSAVVAKTAGCSGVKLAAPRIPPPPPPGGGLLAIGGSCPNHDNSEQEWGCGPDKPCDNGTCCSRWGWCDVTEKHCRDECCQSQCNGATTATLALATPVTLVLAVVLFVT